MVIEFKDLLKDPIVSFIFSWKTFIFSSKELIVPVLDLTKLFFC